MMSLFKKKRKSRIEYDINGRKIEFWMKKITVLMTCLFDVSMFNINSNNEQWTTIIKNIYFNWFLIWFELLVFSDVNGLHSDLRLLLENMQSTNTKFHGKKNGREKWY